MGGFGEVPEGRIDPFNYSTYTTRQNVHLALRRLGERPGAFPCTSFKTEHKEYKKQKPYVRKPVPGTRESNAEKVKKGMSPEQVIDLIDCPDYIPSRDWQYDIDAEKPYTLTISWTDERTVEDVKRGSAGPLARGDGSRPRAVDCHSRRMMQEGPDERLRDCLGNADAGEGGSSVHQLLLDDELFVHEQGGGARLLVGPGGGLLRVPASVRDQPGSAVVLPRRRRSETSSGAQMAHEPPPGRDRSASGGRRTSCGRWISLPSDAAVEREFDVEATAAKATRTTSVPGSTGPRARRCSSMASGRRISWAHMAAGATRTTSWRSWTTRKPCGVTTTIRPCAGRLYNQAIVLAREKYGIAPFVYSGQDICMGSGTDRVATDPEGDLLPRTEMGVGTAGRERDRHHLALRRQHQPHPRPTSWTWA